MTSRGFTEQPFGPGVGGSTAGTSSSATTTTSTATAGNGHDPNPWPLLEPAAYHGLAGEVVAALSPHTESDPAALLLQFLVSFGNAVGRGPYYLIEKDRHFANLFAILVGESSKSRKGTSAGRIRSILELADTGWASDRVMGGMSSGEGVLHAIRDQVTGLRKGIEEVIDAGVDDKRLLLDEREFFQALAVMKREGNIVSRIVRDAWDCRPIIRTLTKHSPTKATNAFISIIGHITTHELQQTLDHTSMANGYANRFLFACVRRSKMLPHGGALPDEATAALGLKTLQALEAARPLDRMMMAPATKELWERAYPKLSESTPGLLGAITGRAEAQTVRLALTYALLDAATQIDEVHLEAALALWAYCAASARYIFGDLLGDTIADAILRALRTAGGSGMARTDISNLVFHRNRSSDEIGRALQLLLTTGRARFTQQPASRGPWKREIWYAT